MLFNYILYFIIVLFLYMGYQPSGGPPGPINPGATLAPILLTYAAFYLTARIALSRSISSGSLARREGRLTVLAVGLYALNIYFFGLKDLIARLPGLDKLSALDGLIGLACFYLFLLLLWVASWPFHRRFTTPEGSLKGHLIGQTRWILPLVLPWLILTTVTDLVDLTAPQSWREALASPLAELGLVAVTLVILSLVLPALVRRAWGCRPLEPGLRRNGIQAFLDSQGVKVAEILTWPVLQGRVITAGVMGVIPRFRYLMITPSLLDSLSPVEIQAVLAHEAAHVKKRHLLLYILFFLGFLVVGFSSNGLILTGLVSWPAGAKWLVEMLKNQAGWYPALIALPLLIIMVVYFRFIFAWFMRNFERQADAVAALTVGVGPVITALERIASLSGLSRRAPSWHHFSIHQRVEFLSRMATRPQTAMEHTALVRRWLGVYLAALALFIALAIPYGGFSSTETIFLRHDLTGLNRVAAEYPNRPDVHLARATVLYRLGDYPAAIKGYRRVLALDPNNPHALNDLAWLLLTGPAEFRNPPEALTLARRAVELRPEAPELDTLAEAEFQAGNRARAVELAQRALAKAKERKEHYQRQVEKFEGKGN